MTGRIHFFVTREIPMTGRFSPLTTAISFAAIVIPLPIATSSARAEHIPIVSPNGLENTEGDRDTTSNVAIGPLRFQNLHPASAFAGLADNQHTLIGFAIRLDESWPAPLTIGFPNLEIRLSTTAVNSLSTTFADNIGSDETLVLSGDVTQTLPLGGPPRGFGEAFQFDTPFVYDPGAGNLLVDVTHGGTDNGFSFDIHSTPGATSWVQNFDIDNPIGEAFQTVLVTQFIFVPEPSSLVLIVLAFGPFTLLRARSGHLSILNIG
jgi:hypothetical protein